MKFRCKHCKNVIAVKETSAGKKIRCPKCQKPVLVPTPKGAGPAKKAAKKTAKKKASGKKRKAGLTCPNCNAAMDAASIVCFECGYDRRSGTVHGEEASSMEDVAKLGGMAAVLIVLAIGAYVLVTSGVFDGLMSGGDSGETVASKDADEDESEGKKRKSSGKKSGKNDDSDENDKKQDDKAGAESEKADDKDGKKKGDGAKNGKSTEPEADAPPPEPEGPVLLDRPVNVALVPIDPDRHAQLRSALESSIRKHEHAGLLPDAELKPKLESANWIAGMPLTPPLVRKLTTALGVDVLAAIESRNVKVGETQERLYRLALYDHNSGLQLGETAVLESKLGTADSMLVPLVDHAVSLARRNPADRRYLYLEPSKYDSFSPEYLGAMSFLNAMFLRQARTHPHVMLLTSDEMYDPVRQHSVKGKLATPIHKQMARIRYQSQKKIGDDTLGWKLRISRDGKKPKYLETEMALATPLESFKQSLAAISETLSLDPPLTLEQDAATVAQQLEADAKLLPPIAAIWAKASALQLQFTPERAERFSREAFVFAEQLAELAPRLPDGEEQSTAALQALQIAVQAEYMLSRSRAEQIKSGAAGDDPDWKFASHETFWIQLEQQKVDPENKFMKRYVTAFREQTLYHWRLLTQYYLDLIKDGKSTPKQAPQIIATAFARSAGWFKQSSEWLAFLEEARTAWDGLPESVRKEQVGLLIEHLEGLNLEGTAGYVSAADTSLFNPFYAWLARQPGEIAGLAKAVVSASESSPDSNVLVQGWESFEALDTDAKYYSQMIQHMLRRVFDTAKGTDPRASKKITDGIFDLINKLRREEKREQFVCLKDYVRMASGRSSLKKTIAEKSKVMEFLGSLRQFSNPTAITNAVHLRREFMESVASDGPSVKVPIIQIPPTDEYSFKESKAPKQLSGGGFELVDIRVHGDTRYYYYVSFDLKKLSIILASSSAEGLSQRMLAEEEWPMPYGVAERAFFITSFSPVEDGAYFSLTNGGIGHLTSRKTKKYSTEEGLPIPGAQDVAAIGGHVYVAHGYHYGGKKHRGHGGLSVFNPEDETFRLICDQKRKKDSQTPLDGGEEYSIIDLEPDPGRNSVWMGVKGDSARSGIWQYDLAANSFRYVLPLKKGGFMRMQQGRVLVHDPDADQFLVIDPDRQRWAPLVIHFDIKDGPPAYVPAFAGDVDDSLMNTAALFGDRFFLRSNSKPPGGLRMLEKGAGLETPLGGYGKEYFGKAFFIATFNDGLLFTSGPSGPLRQMSLSGSQGDPSAQSEALLTDLIENHGKPLRFDVEE